MSHNTQPAGCVLCPIYRPDAQPRHPDLPPVCTPHRYHLIRDLTAIADMHHRLANPTPAETDDRWYQHLDRQGNPRWQRADPLTDIGGSAPIPGRTNQPTVGGTKEPPTPANLTTVDLTNTARAAAIDIQMRALLANNPDQIGHLSVATDLDWWVRDWRDSLYPEQHLPVPTVTSLTTWLANRADDACDHHPAIDEFADKMRSLARTLRAALGETEPPRQIISGIPCRRCDQRGTLTRTPGGDYEAECGNPNCRILYTANDLHQWFTKLAQQTPTPELVDATNTL